MTCSESLSLKRAERLLLGAAVVGLAALGGVFGACDVVGGVTGRFEPDDSVDGWQGPYAVLFSDDEPDACPSAYGEIGVYRQGVQATLSTCDCDVSEAACATTLSVHDTAGCGDPGVTVPLAANTCTDVDADGKHLLAELVATDVACEAASVLGEPRYDQSVRVCGCEGEDCPAPPAIARRCIFQIGEAATCPDPAFSDRLVFFENQEDDRSCDCGLATCEGQLSWHVQLGAISAIKACEEGLLAAPTVQAGECTAMVSSPGATQVRYTMSVFPLSTCERDGEAAIAGELGLTSPVTFCCEP
jgi:hypothetical protein